MSSQPTAYIKEEAVADLGFGDKDRFVEENGLADAVALAQEDSKWSRGGPSKHAAGWEKDDRETFVPPKPTIQPVVELDLDDGDILVITNEQMVSDRTEKIMRDLILSKLSTSGHQVLMLQPGQKASVIHRNKRLFTPAMQALCLVVMLLVIVKLIWWR